METKKDLSGWKPAGYRLAYHPQQGLANLSEEDYKEVKILHRKEEISKIRESINEAFADGNLPYCMDNEYDRARMAEWIFDNNINN